MSAGYSIYNFKLISVSIIVQYYGKEVLVFLSNNRKEKTIIPIGKEDASFIKLACKDVTNSNSDGRIRNITISLTKKRKIVINADSLETNGFLTIKRDGKEERVYFNKNDLAW